MASLVRETHTNRAPFLSATWWQTAKVATLATRINGQVRETYSNRILEKLSSFADAISLLADAEGNFEEPSNPCD